MRAQGAQANAKEDTVLLLLASDADPWVDLSQYDTDLTEDDAPYEDPSVRGAITGATGRELYVRATVEPTDVNGMLLIHADPANSANNTYAILLNGSGDLEFRQGGTLLTTMAVVIAVDSEISVHWSTRANPDTTGASDALISEMIAYNHQAGAYIDIVQVTHAVPTTNVAWALTVCGYWNGVATTLFQTPVIKARIGKAWHTATEFAEDWVAQRSAPDADAQALEDLIPITVASTLGDDGQFVGGPNIAWVAEHNNRKQRALWGPLINDVFTDAEFFGPTNDPVPWVRLAPGSTQYEMRIDWLRWCPIPAGCTHAYVRIQLVSYVTAGAAVPIRVRMYAMNRPEEMKATKYPGLPKFEYLFETSALLSVDNTVSGRGQWLEVGLVRLPAFMGNVTGFTDTVHLCLAYAIDPAGTSGNDANERIKIRAIHARPVYAPQPNLEKG
jgi:hypothetical protein